MPARPSVVSAEFIVHTINANSIFWMSVHQIAVVVEALSGLGASIAYDEERHRVILNSDTPIGRQYADMAAKRGHEAYEAEKKRGPKNDSDSGELIETLRHLLQQWEQRVVCPQCGQRYSDRACGPTHAVVMNLVRPNNADSGQALMSDLLQSELKPDLRKQVIHDDSHSEKDNDAAT